MAVTLPIIALNRNRRHSAFQVEVAGKRAPHGVVSRILYWSKKDIGEVFDLLKTSEKGISQTTSQNRLEKFGLNEIVHEKRDHWLIQLIKTYNNPLILLLTALAILSFVTGDRATGGIISLMIAVSVGLKFYQELQAYNAATHLQSLVKITCSVIRDGKVVETDFKDLVLGDIIQLAAGDIVPADVRLITSKELFINQSLLTGEALPVEKHASIPQKKTTNPINIMNMCFTGTNVESGTAQAVVVSTGDKTYFGSIAKDIVGERAHTDFDKGIDKFTWLMIAFMAIMTPLVFLINGFGKGNWGEAFLFAISVAVGLTPEMLPAIVTVNLSKGAIAMSKRKVIVKRLSSIQNFGAMNILCTDKTGTLTQNKIVLLKNLNIKGDLDDSIFNYAYVNSLNQKGFKNLLDEAVLKHAQENNLTNLGKGYQKIDELPFDFKRRRLSVIVKDPKGKKLLLCKGAVEEVTSVCSKYQLNGNHELRSQDIKIISKVNQKASNEGFRVIALAYKELENGHTHYSNKDENDMVFLGFMTFFDPSKESAARAIDLLEKHGVAVKVLTGDNELVTRKVSYDVNLKVEGVLLGDDIEKMDDAELQKQVVSTTIFAKLSPDHKKRVVLALQQKGNVVGFLGDGINDAPALRVADVGISVNEAVDIAKESSDIILLELSLLVLEQGVVEGRKVFGNITKYIKMGASSNFGNMFSVLGASLFLPFLPMAPLQILTNNLLYDISQTAIPTDNVDHEYLTKPRRWEISDIRRFMIFIGSISSIFDYITFGVMILVFHALKSPMLFQTGWFVESLLTQTLIVHVIRSRKIPFIQTLASKPLLATTVIIMAIGIYLPFSPIAQHLDFVHLPTLYWPILILILTSYVGLTQVIKTWYITKFGYN